MESEKNNHNKKRNLIIMSILLILVSIAICFKYLNYLPPRTPRKIASIQSGLQLTKSFLIDFQENYSFNGEGFTYVRLGFPEQYTDRIIADCKKQGYKKMTINNLVLDGFLESNRKSGLKVIGSDITDIKDGYYKLNITDINSAVFNISIFDVKRVQLITYTNM